MNLQVDDVDDVLANINEQNDAMEQINAAMGQPIGPSADIDEDDLEKEFEVCSAFRAAVDERRCPWLACSSVLCYMGTRVSTNSRIPNNFTVRCC